MDLLCYRLKPSINLCESFIIILWNRDEWCCYEKFISHIIVINEYFSKRHQCAKQYTVYNKTPVNAYKKNQQMLVFELSHNKEITVQQALLYTVG